MLLYRRTGTAVKDRNAVVYLWYRTIFSLSGEGYLPVCPEEQRFGKHDIFDRIVRVVPLVAPHLGPAAHVRDAHHPVRATSSDFAFSETRRLFPSHQRLPADPCAPSGTSATKPQPTTANNVANHRRDCKTFPSDVFLSDHGERLSIPSHRTPPVKRRKMTHNFLRSNTV